MMLDGKRILITGGTGSLGIALTKKLLEANVEIIRIYSRNESKQVEMRAQLDDPRLRFLIGDIRDLERLTKAMEDIDIVFHTAALKHVPVVEYNPFEAIKTNVLGSQNVIDACLKENVEIAICIGTDKAVSPLNTYGATKLLAEKLFVSANNYLDKKKYRTKFFAVRYGNVLGSSNSVIPLFIKKIKSGQKITITNSNMTRFSLTMSEALDFILHAIDIGKGSEIFIPKLKAYSITDVKNVLWKILENTGEEEIGIRPGEKIHEQMIGLEDALYTYEYPSYYKILPSINDWAEDEQRIGVGVQVSQDFTYCSDNNKEWMKISELQNWLKLSRNQIGII